MTPCIAIFDIGKTTKKILLFDQDYQIIKEEEVSFRETRDEDGDKSEDLEAVTNWLRATWKALEADRNYDVLAVNFTAYGASLVHLNEAGEPVAPLYNYLKPFPEDLEKQFYSTYGDKLAISAETASPPLGMLNAGLQLYWLKHRKPEVFAQIKHTLLLPQYIAYLFTGEMTTEYTSIGCHTALWDFQKKDYHAWVYAEGFDKLLPPLRHHYRPLETSFRDGKILAGLGLHDSSAALIPYLKQYRKPFLLLSTGTWGITLNPFAKQPLSTSDLQHDCLKYLTYRGNPVKASRKFIGNVHEEQVRRLAGFYDKPLDYHESVRYEEHLANDDLQPGPGKTPKQGQTPTKDTVVSAVSLDVDFALYDTYEAAYHQVVEQLIRQLLDSLLLAAEGDTSDFKLLLVEGSFSRNQVFLALLKRAFPGLRIKAREEAQGTALGAALALNVWPY
ncbi:FGGY-family carbohydrate kinase [Pontibacter russatus]|uniref:FGGY-family carbohydrate kinase n=1 Tax=Pontibacter russatus TaxID=2694929 RepID=UPI00137A3F0C|nr:FGGY family carbohydrate kinase [Pontibacter russatus]